MEVFTNYKGYGIRYVSITGTTYVEDFGEILKIFRGCGELMGNKLAREYIDNLINY